MSSMDFFYCFDSFMCYSFLAKSWVYVNGRGIKAIETELIFVSESSDNVNKIDFQWNFHDFV